MEQLVYGKDGQLSFKTKEDLYIAIGFLASSDSVSRIYFEENQKSGARGNEWRIDFYSKPENMPKSIMDSITFSPSNNLLRLNNKEFVQFLQTCGFNYGNSQNIENIKKTIPSEYMNDFNIGFNS